MSVNMCPYWNCSWVHIIKSLVLYVLFSRKVSSFFHPYDQILQSCGHYSYFLFRRSWVEVPTHRLTVLTDDSRGVLHPSRQMSGCCLKLDHSHFLPCPFKFIIHWSCHLMLCLLWTPSLNTSTYIVKLKFSLCLIKYHVSIKTRRMDVQLHAFLTLRRVVYFTSMLLYPWGMSPWYPLRMRLGGSQSQLRCCEEENSYYTNSAIPADSVCLISQKVFSHPQKITWWNVIYSLRGDDVYQWIIYLAHLWIIIENYSCKLWALL
jgi:hypothetical protein